MKQIIEETVKSLWRDLSPLGKLYLPLAKKDLQFKSHNIEFAKEFSSDEEKIDKLIQGILTRALTKEPGKWVSAIAAKNLTDNIVQNYQNGQNITVEFEEITTEFPYSILDSILTIGVTTPSLRDAKFRLAKQLIEPKLKICKFPSIEEIKEADLAFDLWQKNSYVPEKVGLGFAVSKDIKICRNNLWAYYSPSLKLKFGIYYTPEKFIKQSESIVKKYTKPTDIIWEPFAGDGRLIKNFANQKIISDILAIPGTIKHDYIKEQDFKYDIIYTNPGFSVATKAFEKMLSAGKPFGIYIPDYAVPNKPLPIREGFYTYSKEWPNLPVNNSSKNGFGIVFLFVDPRIQPVRSIILKDQQNRDVLLELSSEGLADLFDFGTSNFRRYHPQEYGMAYNHLFKGKYVDGTIGQFVRNSWIKTISYLDGRLHWWTNPDGKSVQKLVHSQKELDEMIGSGWIKGRKQKISKIRRKD